MTRHQMNHPTPPARGFTLVEIVLVVAIISLIAAISITVGSSMADSGRKRATESVLQVLDQALDDFINTTGAVPPSLVAIKLEQDIDSNSRGDTVYYPAIDGVFNSVIPSDNPSAPERHYQINSIGLFLHSISTSSDVPSILENVDSKFVKNYDYPMDLQPGMTTIFDAWGNPIRYVHPKFDGIVEDGRRVAADPGMFLDVMDPMTGFFTEEMLPTDLSLIPFTEVRRNKILASDRAGFLGIEADSDGGLCPSQRPYFYSAGPDGDPSTIEDNVYTTVPEFVNPL
ncbi:MAG: prepilin-type N-terminal cleavage/methylation domain-containing protein [Phycisphaerales bacterium]|nr:prepilin-type N-terminal cleavage/methylation domain-containing protein [Phycisphaerales bacterium]